MKIQLITGFILASLFLSSTGMLAGNQALITDVQTKLNHPSSTDLELDQTNTPTSKPSGEAVNAAASKPSVSPIVLWNN